MDPVKNFGKVTVSIGYNNTDITIVLATGDGTKLPNPGTDGAFNLVWWNFTQYPDPSDDPNKEIIRCTAKSIDTLTITRAQEGTTASTKNAVGKTYLMALTVTKKLIDDINSQLATTDQKAALAGTTGTPSVTNKYVTDQDSRNTNARTPTSHGNEVHTSNYVEGNIAIIAATKTKVTYDTKGLITVGADAITSDILDSIDKRYVTDAEKTKLTNLSGVNTGDQTITLTGDVTGSGTGSLAATIAAGAVTYAKMQNISVTDKVLGRVTAGAGSPEEIACTAAGRALIDDADAATQRTTLGLGSMATQAANAVAITGGAISGITDLPIADGGTGASTAAAARTNLGCVGVNAGTTGQYASTKYTCTVTLDWNNGNVQYIVLANGAQTFTFANPIDGARYMIILKQPATGAAGTVTWPATVLWPGGTAPTLTATNGKVDIVTFVYDGTNTKYYGGNSLNY